MRLYEVYASDGSGRVFLRQCGQAEELAKAQAEDVPLGHTVKVWKHETHGTAKAVVCGALNYLLGHSKVEDWSVPTLVKEYQGTAVAAQETETLFHVLEEEKNTLEDSPEEAELKKTHVRVMTAKHGQRFVLRGSKEHKAAIEELPW